MDTLQRLGEVLCDDGKAEQAEVLLIECLSTRRKALGGLHASTIEAIKALSLCYYAAKKYVLAGPLMIEWVRASRKTHGPDSTESLQAMVRLGTLYTDLKNYSRAEPLFLEAKERLAKKYSPSHPETLKVLNLIAMMFWNQKAYADAERVYLEIIAILDQTKREWDERHPSSPILVSRASHQDTLKYMNNLGLLYREQGKFELVRFTICIMLCVSIFNCINT